MICRFCKKEADTPCMAPFDAALRCGVEERVVEQQVLQESMKPQNLARNTIEIVEAERPEDDAWANAAPDSFRKTRRMLKPVPERDLPNIFQNDPPKSNFVFDENVLMLLKEAQAQLKKSEDNSSWQNFDKVWSLAKMISKDYEIVMEPTLKKRSGLSTGV